jgi:hypothetical protein
LREGGVVSEDRVIYGVKNSEDVDIFSGVRENNATTKLFFWGVKEQRRGSLD